MNKICSEKGYQKLILINGIVLMTETFTFNVVLLIINYVFLAYPYAQRTQSMEKFYMHKLKMANFCSELIN